ncbi:hypothetical protein ACFZB9_13665 [Kitasatospora sp. NPDC008050]
MARIARRWKRARSAEPPRPTGASTAVLTSQWRLVFDDPEPDEPSTPPAC